MSRIIRIDPHAPEAGDVVVDPKLFQLGDGHTVSLTRHSSRYGRDWFSLSCTCGDYEEENLSWWAPRQPSMPHKPKADSPWYTDNPGALDEAMEDYAEQVERYETQIKEYRRLVEEDPHGYSAAVERHRRVLAGEKGIYECGCTVDEGSGNYGGMARHYNDWEKKPGVKKACPKHNKPYIPKNKPKKPALTSSQVLDRLAFGYKAPEWVFLRELRLGTGYGSREYDLQAGELVDHGWEQRLDAFAMNCYPSKGFLRIAFEVKVSRSDFLSEIKNPDKRAAALRHSNQFYFVCPEGLVKPEEIPVECGLIEIKTTGGRRTVVKAPVRECAQEMPLRFVASLLRHMNKTQDE